MRTMLGDPVHGDVSSSSGMRESTIVIAGGVLATITAIVLLLFPAFTSVAVTAVTGWCLLVGGALLAVTSVAVRERGGRLSGVAFGLLLAIAGLLLVTNLLAGTMTLTAIAIAWLLVDGVVGVALALALHPEYWGATLFVSLLGIALGLMLWSDWPSSATWALGVYAGVVLLGRGLTLLGGGVALRSTGE